MDSTQPTKEFDMALSNETAARLAQKHVLNAMKVLSQDDAPVDEALDGANQHLRSAFDSLGGYLYGMGDE